MRYDPSFQALASLSHEVREQMEEHRRMGEGIRERLRLTQSWLMEQHCINEHLKAVARIEAANKITRLTEFAAPMELRNATFARIP
jgi:hypothetical protein